MIEPKSHAPDAATQRAARTLALAAPAVTLAVIVAEALFGPNGTRESAISIAVVVSGVMLLALWAVQAREARPLVVAMAAAVIDAVAIVGGAILPIGLAVAVALPYLSAALLMMFVDGRRLRFGLVASWLSGMIGAAWARIDLPPEAVPNASPVVLSIAFLAVLTGTAYVVLSWAASRMQAAVAEAQAAAEQARLAEIAQQRSAERFRALVEHSPLPTLAFGPTGLVQAWNPAAQRLTGWSQEDVIGKSVTSIVPEDLRPGVRARLARTFETGRVSGVRPTRFLTRDGREVRVEIYDAVEWGVDGLPAEVVVQFVDVTEREAVAERLIETQRLEAVGRLAGGVAHDFNNSLTAIAGFASLIATGDSPDPRDDARTILGAAEHASVLTRQLLGFARKAPLQPQTIDMGEFIAAVEPLVRSLAGETVVLRREIEPGPLRVSVDPSSLEQAILNLATNARDAMPMGGEMTLVARLARNCVGGGGGPEDHVVVAVSDTGTGIAPSIINRVFDPFFTTKPIGKGTGLGLPMVHGYAAQSGGHVVISSPPGAGATVELHFPESHALISEPDARAEAVRGKEAILYVEDDPGVAAFGLACLRRLGYEVTPAMNGTEAVALAAARSEPFDLLLTDVVIPGMSGSELAGIIHRHHPSTAILYASGYSPEHIDSLVLGPEAPLLEKPYSLEQLSAKVREALETSRARGQHDGNGRDAGPR